MQLQISVDGDRVMRDLASLPGMTRRELARALDRTANDVQSDQRADLRASFSISPARQAFMRNLIKRRPGDRATAAKLEATVRIEGPQSDTGRGVLLTRHEEGGTHHDTGLFFIPTKELRPTSTSVPPRNMYPRALRLMDQQGIGGATASTLAGGSKGKRRRIAGVNSSVTVLRKAGLGGTFLIRDASGRAAIYQRQGEGREGLVRLWTLVPTVRLAPRLRFFENAMHTIDARWRQHVEEAVEAALAKL